MRFMRALSLRAVMTSEFAPNNKKFSGNNDIHMWFASRLMSSLFRVEEGDVTKSQLRSTNNEGKEGSDRLQYALESAFPEL